jgi:hypothetical protein
MPIQAVKQDGRKFEVQFKEDHMLYLPHLSKALAGTPEYTVPNSGAQKVQFYKTLKFSVAKVGDTETIHVEQGISTQMLFTCAVSEIGFNGQGDTTLKIGYLSTSIQKPNLDGILSTAIILPKSMPYTSGENHQERSIHSRVTRNFALTEDARLLMSLSDR